MTDIFNNRELATIIWLSLFSIWALLRADIRASLYGVFKALLGRQMILALSSMVLYVAVMVLISWRVGFWDKSAIKDTVLWVLGGAVVLFFNAGKAAGDEHYFREVVFDNLKLVLVLEFVVNTYTFSLPAELVIVPLTTFLVMLKTVAGLRAEHREVDAVLAACRRVVTLRQAGL